MKRRIVKELAILAKAPLMKGLKSKYQKDLMADFNLTESELPQLQRAAGQALRDLLFDYAEFNVSTIDAFFQSVLRSFAFEADLSGNYEVSLDSDMIIENGIADTFMQAVNDSNPDTRRWMQDFMSSSLRDGKSFNLLHKTGEMRTSLRKFIQALTDEDFQRKSDEIESFIRSQSKGSGNPVATLRQKLLTVLDELKTSLPALASALLSDPYSDGLNKKSAIKFLGNVASGTINATPAVLAKVDEPEKLFVSSATPPSQAYLLQLSDLIRGCISMNTVVELLKQIHSFGLFEAITDNINRIKADANTILLSDTNTLLRRIISDSPSPFLYERTGLKLHHYLIDEFQDTSRLQWEILKPLVVESVATGHDNLIIGDVKQCIYRFRSSDPKLLGSDLQLDSDLSANIEEIYQGINYRSASHIVKFNYDLFHKLGLATGNSGIYPAETDPIRQDAPSGFVNLAGLPPDGFTNAAFNRMFDEICRQLDPDNGNYQPSDIAILTDTNDQASSIINYLLERFADTPGMETVQVMGDESLKLTASSAVRRLIAMLGQLISTPTPTSVKNDQYSKVTPMQLDWLASEFESRRTDSSNDPYAQLTELIDEFHQKLDNNEIIENGKKLSSGSLINIVESLIADLPEYLREKDSVYIYAFMDLVTEFCQTSQTATIHSFIQWWKLSGNKSCITSSAGTEAIRVMTIHKAKGLEFDCVHIPLVTGTLGKEISIRWYDCGHGSNNVFTRLGIEGPVPRYFPLRSSTALSNTMFAPTYETLLRESVLDDLNALYVAFTRPKRELTVSVCGRPVNKKSPDNPLNIDLLLCNATGVMRSTDGSWNYQSGSPTTKIHETENSDPDMPAYCRMPSFNTCQGKLTEILSEITDE